MPMAAITKAMAAAPAFASASDLFALRNEGWVALQGAAHFRAHPQSAATLDADRAAILAMAGDHKVPFASWERTPWRAPTTRHSGKALRRAQLGRRANRVDEAIVRGRELHVAEVAETGSAAGERLMTDADAIQAGRVGTPAAVAKARADISEVTR
ncbi:hypothetical protein HMP06_0608 [Sphingomonas sp. HMP6]|nr:hypothetical protein HMP06_0608 [Sphingomonas sp. HMP6]